LLIISILRNLCIEFISVEEESQAELLDRFIIEFQENSATGKLIRDNSLTGRKIWIWDMIHNG